MLLVLVVVDALFGDVVVGAGGLATVVATGNVAGDEVSVGLSVDASLIVKRLNNIII